MPARYDTIGHGYAATRRADPRLERRLLAALEGAASVVNVGAGAGSYEPTDRHVVAIEPSDVMASQRPPSLAPALRASAGDLPLRDASVDAALAVLTVHHWGPEQVRGVRELRRVARGPVVIVTFDPAVNREMWLVRDYLPQVGEQDAVDFPTPAQLAAWLGPGRFTAEPYAIPRDTPDWTFGSLWAHPERALDERVTSATSGFARLDPDLRVRATEALRADLASGAWDRRHGHLRELAELDVGLRIVTHRPEAARAG